MSQLHPSVEPTLPPNPTLIPVFSINLKTAGSPAPIYTNKENGDSVSSVQVSHGEIKTVENKFGFKLEVNGISGSDDLTSNSESGASTLDCRLYGKTPNGAGVKITYQGVSLLSEELINVVTGKSKLAKFEKCYLTSNPKFEFDSDVPQEYKWVLKENLIAKGRFARDDNDELYVQYYVYIMR